MDFESRDSIEDLKPRKRYSTRSTCAHHLWEVGMTEAPKSGREEATTTNLRPAVRLKGLLRYDTTTISANGDRNEALGAISANATSAVHLAPVA
jgi:hypothetical protein